MKLTIFNTNETFGRVCEIIEEHAPESIVSKTDAALLIDAPENIFYTARQLACMGALRTEPAYVNITTKKNETSH